MQFRPELNLGPGDTILHHVTVMLARIPVLFRFWGGGFSPAHILLASAVHVPLYGLVVVGICRFLLAPQSLSLAARAAPSWPAQRALDSTWGSCRPAGTHTPNGSSDHRGLLYAWFCLDRWMSASSA